MGKASCGSTDQVLDQLCTPPEVCGADAEDNKRQHLLKQTTDDGDNFIQKTLKRDKPLLVGIVMMIVLMRIPYLKFILYPFMIFSTWVHEMCHGMAAVFVGGGISKLMVYKDGSGLCYTWTSGEDWKRAIVSSAGYNGTALIGCVMLLMRRTRRGPTVGLIAMGLAMLLSCALYVRNIFGVVTVTGIGVFSVICGWKLPVRKLLYLYSFMAACCSFNALDAMNDLMDIQPGEAYVNGQESSTDAHSVADLIGMTYGFWAFLWLLFGLIMSAIGLFFPFDGVTVAQNKRQQRKAEEGALPQHGALAPALVDSSYTTSGAPPAYQEPSASAPPPPAMNPQFQQQSQQPGQHSWVSPPGTEIPIAQATIY